ncbi:MAG: SirA protein [Rhodospirillaceae bacterium]|nr:SirA protein [Rhodospirillaceae bacterium]|tara:strand:- start:28455 stop:28712 length:258 start_codon:yes stop_codon:yes gene_type:complete
MTGKPKNFLDITKDVCPMTFVKTRLLIEKMATGDVAEILLMGEEPLENVPASVTELGHTILSFEPNETSESTNLHSVHRLIIRKS